MAPQAADEFQLPKLQDKQAEHDPAAPGSSCRVCVCFKLRTMLRAEPVHLPAQMSRLVSVLCGTISKHAGVLKLRDLTDGLLGDFHIYI